MAIDGLRIYDRAAVRVNGRYVVHSTSVKLSYRASDSIVTLLGGGSKKTFAVAPGARLLQIQWSMCVPSDESDDLMLIRSFANCDRVKVGVDMFGSGLGLTSEGFLQEPSLSSQIGSTMEYSISFIGEPATF